MALEEKLEQKLEELRLPGLVELDVSKFIDDGPDPVPWMVSF